MPMPTMPEIEPLARTKNERISGQRPPLWAFVKHYARQLVPNPRFVLKWCATGALMVAGIMVVSLLGSHHLLEGANADARKVFTDRKAEIKRKADFAVKEQAEAKNFQDLTARAIANWNTWKSQFTSETDGIACAHGSNKEKTVYEISCQIGPKGSLPAYLIVCNQGSCATPDTIILLHAPEKKK